MTPAVVMMKMEMNMDKKGLFEMKTTLINLRTYRGKKDYVLIDRRTVFGNPFAITLACTRKQSVAKYKAYFYNRITWNPRFLRQALKLKGKKLACWCTPLACHGDIIIEFLDKEHGCSNS